MDQATFLWTLAGTVFAGVALFMQKIVAEEKRSSAFYGLISYGVAGVIGSALLVFLPELPPHWRLLAVFGFAGGAAHGIANFARIESLKYIDSVLFFPLNKMLGPLLVLIGGVFIFGDSLKPIQYLGIGLSLTVPLLLVSSVEHQRQNNLSLGLKILTISTIFSAAAVLLAKQGLLYSSSVIIMLSTSQIAGMIASAAILWRQHGAGFAMISHADKRDIQLGVWSGIISFISSFCLFEAMTTGLVSLVYVIQAHYILIPIILSVWWYKDHINLRKFAAVVVSFLAIGLLYLA